MAQIEVGFGAVLGYENLAVLIRAHCAGVDIDIGVELLRGNLIAPAFQKSAQRSRRNALAKPRNNAACNENILCHNTLRNFLYALSKIILDIIS